MPFALTRALRARRARPPEVPEAAARAACVSTWLGEHAFIIDERLFTLTLSCNIDKITDQTAINMQNIILGNM